MLNFLHILTKMRYLYKNITDYYITDWNGRQVKCQIKIESFISDILTKLSLVVKIIDEIYSNCF